MSSFRLFSLVFFLAAPVFAAVDGTVTNRTTGKPQPGVDVTLMKLGGGMEPAGTVKTDAAGRFRFETNLEGPGLIQAAYGGVNYNKMVQPGAAATGVGVDVFESTSEPGAARVSQHMILLEPSSAGISLNESIVFENAGSTTFNPPDGSLRFYLPPAAKGDVRVSISGPGGMPIQRPAEKTAVPNVYTVKFPVRPGETRFDLSYTLPAGQTLESRILHGGGPVRIVAPNGVTLTGDSISDLGKEPRTQATVYDVKGDAYKIAIAGTGSLRAAAEAAGITEGQEDTGPPIEQKNPRIYTRLAWVLAFVFAILAVGLTMVYRRA